MDINKLKNFNVDRAIDLDEVFAASAEIRTLENEYGTMGRPTPEWVASASKSVREEIARRTQAQDLAELQKLERELEGYKTVSEKKAETQKRLAALQKKMGMAPASK